MASLAQTNVPSQSDILIGGGGFSGTTIAEKQIDFLIRNRSRMGERKATIAIVDPSGKYGPGHPYEDRYNDRLVLNQPLYCMSPDPADPDLAARWVSDNRHKLVESGFMSERDVSALTFDGIRRLFIPRPVYGDFLGQRFQEACENAVANNIEISKVQGSLTHVHALDDSFVNEIEIEGVPQPISSTVSIIADGHYSNDFLNELKGKENYYQGKVSLDELGLSLLRYTQGVAIVGSGQDMMDRLAQFNALNFDHPIHVISRRGVKPWLFDPALYDPKRKAEEYRLSVFTPEDVRKVSGFANLKTLWDSEIIKAGQSVARDGLPYGPGHVLAAYFKKIHDFDSDIEGWPEMESYIQAYYGNPTAPQRMAMLEKYEQTGQLQFHTSAVNAESIKAGDRGYDFTIALDNGTSLEVDAIFNSAGCARAAREKGHIHSPLIAALDAKEYIRWDPNNSGILVPGKQNKPGLYYGGPFAFGGKWGCETFRGVYGEIAQDSVSYLLDREI